MGSADLLLASSVLLPVAPVPHQKSFGVLCVPVEWG